MSEVPTSSEKTKNMVGKQPPTLIDVEAKAESWDIQILANSDEDHDLTVTVEPKESPEEKAQARWERRLKLKAAVSVAMLIALTCVGILLFSKDPSLTKKALGVLVVLVTLVGVYLFGKSQPKSE